jgi:hypothetical protein
VDLAANVFGMVNSMWLFDNATPSAAATTGLWNNVEDFVAFCGMHLGKGMVSARGLLATPGSVTTNGQTIVLSGLTLLGATATGVSYVGTGTGTGDTVREIRSPSGGVMQFKGLTQTTTNDKYVEVNCRHIEGYWSVTPWSDITNTTSGTSGFIVSCMTGISQCTGNNILSNATAVMV